MPEIILPGTYVTIRDEGLISAGRVVTGNIGIVGTASKGPINEVQILGTFSEARAMFGNSDPWINGESDELTLIRALEQIYNNGGRTVYAVRTTSTNNGATTATTASHQINNNADPAITFTAKSAGTWGNNIMLSVSSIDEDTKKVELIYQGAKEVYQVANVIELNEAINDATAPSNLVSSALGVGGVEAFVLPNTTDPISLADGTDGADASADDYRDSLALLESDIINIVLLAGQDASNAGMLTALTGHIEATEGIKRERIALIGSSASTDVTVISEHNISNDRMIFVAPGIKAGTNNLPGAYTAAAVTGLISSLPVHTSPTNKTLNIPGLTARFSSSQLEKLVTKRVLAIEQRNGFRVVKGITTATNSAWHQITTRRIVDYATYGVRSGCDPYIGKLNNERVRGAMKATLDAFLTRMVEDEALISYELDVTATRAQQIAGEAIVTMVIRPTFSIDFIKVTMYLE